MNLYLCMYMDDYTHTHTHTQTHTRTHAHTHTHTHTYIHTASVLLTGVPDGMSVDSEGNLWIASFFGACVLKFSPQGKLLNHIKFPARRTTSCCFGGSNYSTLFVTSASVQASSEEMASYPNTGAVFIVKNPGATGLPAWNFDDSALTV